MNLYCKDCSFVFCFSIIFGTPHYWMQFPLVALPVPALSVTAGWGHASPCDIWQADYLPLSGMIWTRSAPFYRKYETNAKKKKKECTFTQVFLKIPAKQFFWIISPISHSDPMILLLWIFEIWLFPVTVRQDFGYITIMKRYLPFIGLSLCVSCLFSVDFRGSWHICCRCILEGESKTKTCLREI